LLRLYDYLPSGNGYKVRLLLTQLAIPFELITLDIWNGATRTPEFLAKNPNGRIPTLQLDDGRHLWESHAILWYLGEGTAFLPADRLARALVQQWMCFEQYEVEPALGVIRARTSILGGKVDSWRDVYEEKRKRGLAALEVLEKHLQDHIFMVNHCYSIADIAIYGYVHVGSEAGFKMEDYPNVHAWMDRVVKQPNHIPITWQPK